MNYSNLSEIEELVKSLPRQPSFTDAPILFEGGFKPIIIDSFEIHLFASKSSYCLPHETLDSLSEYDSVQVHIEETLAKQEQKSLILPYTDERFSYFEWKNYFYYDNGGNRRQGSYIGSRVPLKVVYQIVKDINKLSKLRTFF
jgi:hypothetical protein